ncbi:permease [Halococcus salifodinae]|uniref:Putative metal ion permease n=1 Tax=Halococcus salifodinae DSM 8989 TaxID=1227456 RepID=M0NAQ5_9EURY|nr:permease [Halococcus salifodinae]EMA54951.1 putative metal ion permease [Halococcus salifodinae DSM 8989]
MAIVDGLVEAGRFVAEMTWKTWWALVLGFTIAGAVQAFVTEERMTDLLGGRGLRALGLGSFFGFLSSSCSFGAVATTKSIFKKGASPEASFGAFQFASTNLVIEIGLVMWILLGWQFVAADVFGGILMILLLAGITKYVVPDEWFAAARENLGDEGARDPVCGMEVDPEEEDTYSVETDDGTEYFCSQSCKETYRNRDTDDTWRDKLLTREGWKNAFRNAIGEWDMLWKDIAAGFVVAALIAAFVPESFWTGLFSLAPEGTFAWVALGSVIGVAVGVLTFVCSVANIPFAVVLWNAGIPFGGVMSFIFADLIVPHIVNMYRKYYGARLAAVLFVSIFTLAAVSGVVIHYTWATVGLIPQPGSAGGTAPSGYATILNVVFSAVFLAEIYVTFFESSGGDEGTMAHAD